MTQRDDTLLVCGFALSHPEVPPIIRQAIDRLFHHCYTETGLVKQERTHPGERQQFLASEIANDPADFTTRNLTEKKSALKVTPPLINPPEKSKQGRFNKLTEADLDPISARIAAAEKPEEIAPDYDVSSATIINFLKAHNRPWSHWTEEKDARLWKHIALNGGTTTSIYQELGCRRASEAGIRYAHLKHRNYTPPTTQKPPEQKEPQLGNF